MIALQSLRIVFAGTPDFAVPPLAALLEGGFEPVAVYTQPDRPAGRGKKLQASPVKTLALEAGIPVRQPPSLRDPLEQQDLARLFDSVWTLDPGQTGHRLWRRLGDRDWMDLLNLMDCYRRMHRLAEERQLDLWAPP